MNKSVSFLTDELYILNKSKNKVEKKKERKIITHAKWDNKW